MKSRQEIPGSGELEHTLISVTSNLRFRIPGVLFELR